MNKLKNAETAFGELPSNAPLAMAYIPVQKSAVPAYDSAEALARGTLFPGLDLPFMGVVNNCFERTPRNELMSIDFVLDELELYLDTHADDREAFLLYQSFLSLEKEAKERYTALYGPVQQCDQMNASSYTWLHDPWPWDYSSVKEGR